MVLFLEPLLLLLLLFAEQSALLVCSIIYMGSSEGPSPSLCKSLRNKLLCISNVCIYRYLMQSLRSLSLGYIYAKQKHPGCKKSARPIRSSIANRYVLLKVAK